MGERLFSLRLVIGLILEVLVDLVDVLDHRQGFLCVLGVGFGHSFLVDNKVNFCRVADSYLYPDNIELNLLFSLSMVE